jgi:glycosyltransferase involved in cell wall biosynthesis
MSTMSSKVSIILPTYNQAEYLPAALDSIFAQTYPDYEVVVVNDGSTDDTAGVLARYQREHEFTVITQENQGLPRALNTGFAQAHGDYLTWTSSDNIMLPEMLSALVDALDRDPTVGLVYADFYLMDDSGQDLGRFETVDYDPHWFLYTNLVHCCFMYRRECKERVGGYEPDFIYSEDYEYWIRISRYYSMKRVPQVLYRYRLHKSSMTGEMERGVARDMGWVKFSAQIRRQMPVRWYMHKLKRWWAYLSPTGHPVVRERRAWLRAVRQVSLH